ncbi:MAG: thermonuclease family protein [Desulfobulbaceae bacterium]
MLAKVDVTGDVQGLGCLLLELKDAIRLGGTLIMLPDDSLEGMVGAWCISSITEQFFGHSKKRNKMPPFFCTNNEPPVGCEKQGSRLWLQSLFSLLCCLFLIHGDGSCLAATPSNELFSARVMKVVDGDSLEVIHQGKTLRVRLWGIDTPEWQQEFSHKALAFTRARVQGRRVELQPKAWDKYGRLVAVVKVGGHTLNEELLREGLAWVHIYYCKEPICREWRQLEKEARMTRRGLWQGDTLVPPWKWKQGRK